MLRYDELKNTLDQMIRARPILSEGLPGQALSLMRQAKVIRFGREHVPIITRNPGAQPIGWQVIHPVFPCIHVEIDGGFICASKDILNMTLFAGKTDSGDEASEYALVGIAFGNDLSDEGRPAIFKLPTFFYDAQGNPTRYERASQWAPLTGSHGLTLGTIDPLPWNALNGIARNVLDFLALPSVRIHVEPGMEKINRSRRIKNKPPLTDYHIVRWSETSHAAETSDGSGIKHRVRYDVRGNWATFTRGMLAGQRIWRRPHQRGPVDAPFRLKGYQR